MYPASAPPWELLGNPSGLPTSLRVHAENVVRVEAFELADADRLGSVPRCPAAHIAATVVAHVPGESSPPNRGRRLLRRANRDVPAPVRPGDPCARAPPCRARRGDRPAHG